MPVASLGRAMLHASPRKRTADDVTLKIYGHQWSVSA